MVPYWLKRALEKVQTNKLVRQKDSGNKGHQEAEKLEEEIEEMVMLSF